MLLRTLLRSSAATYVVPLLILFLLVALGQSLTSGTTPHYWPAVTASSLYSLPFICTISAGLGAWEGARAAKGRIFDHPSTRSRLHITAVVLAPVVVGSFVACLASLTTAAVSANVSLAIPDWRVLLAELCLIIANTLVGYCIGRRLDAVLSVPLSLVGAFIANAYPKSWSILWLRHLVGGGLTECCAPDEVLNARAVEAAVVFGMGISLSCLVVIAFATSRAAMAASLVLVVAATGTAVGLAHQLPPAPIVARSDSELRCSQEPGVMVCLWPEVQHPTKIRAQAVAITRALRSAEVPVPSLLTMSAHLTDSASKFGILTESNPEAVRSGVVSGLMPTVPPCALHHPYPGAEAVAPVAAWMLLVAGDTPAQVTSHADEKTAKLAQRIAALPAASQKAWLQRNLGAMHSCNIKPQLNPPGIGEV